MNPIPSAVDPLGRARARSVAEPPGRVEVTHVAHQAYAVFVRDHEFTVDQPSDAGGDNEGPTPVELFVASLASCVAYYAGRFLQRHDLPYEHLRVSADFTMADDRPARIADVCITVRPPSGLSAARLAGLLAVARHCTVHNTLEEPPRITLDAA
ncbi:OsmC family protein [Streptomyces sp. VRA16 Mangrove soil]|uniref:OsmC family protein n=1 Tax=Streptomyces sp. VRA16 Mangrove soil TaxID=2817434 RepID=UPI001A9F3B2F|nr:OsmC family protein [Streptomyces sp. VRA16 Mangrove soil]MBO1333019.1 OsmC family protein [Streptomyces sp. VRA16 Mangrove soil]